MLILFEICTDRLAVRRHASTLAAQLATRRTARMRAPWTANASVSTRLLTEYARCGRSRRQHSTRSGCCVIAVVPFGANHGRRGSSDKDELTSHSCSGAVSACALIVPGLGCAVNFFSSGPEPPRNRLILLDYRIVYQDGRDIACSQQFRHTTYWK